MIFDNKIDIKTFLAIMLIITLGVVFMYLRKNNYQLNVTGYNIEHFPSSLRYSDKIRRQPKKIIPKLGTEMVENTRHYDSLPDDYEYLYDYEKNFKESKVYGDYNSRLEAYKGYLYSHKNSFHTLNDIDIDNLTKLLNEVDLSNSDIPDNFKYSKDFTAVNN